MKQNKYIVEDLEKDNYLSSKYYIGGRTSFFSDAYRFSAFELKLASTVLLKPNDRYRVYKIEVEDDNLIN